MIIGGEIPNFLKIIEEKKRVDSPRFKFSGDVDGVQFFIRVCPGNEDLEFISVYLRASKEDQITSVTFLEASGTRMSWEMTDVPLSTGWGYKKFLSLKMFQTWAKKHGDVFKLKATVTLHKQEETGGDWIRYCSLG